MRSAALRLDRGCHITRMRRLLGQAGVHHGDVVIIAHALAGIGMLDTDARRPVGPDASHFRVPVITRRADLDPNATLAELQGPVPGLVGLHLRLRLEQVLVIDGLAMLGMARMIVLVMKARLPIGPVVAMAGVRHIFHPVALFDFAHDRFLASFTWQITTKLETRSI